MWNETRWEKPNMQTLLGMGCSICKSYISRSERKVRYLKVDLARNFLHAASKPLQVMVNLLFFPNLNLLCSNGGGWLALFCTGSFSRDWEAINLIGRRLIWLISTVEYGAGDWLGYKSAGITGYSPVIATTHCLSDEIGLGCWGSTYRIQIGSWEERTNGHWQPHI